MNRVLVRVALGLWSLGVMGLAPAQDAVDAKLYAEISRIRAIDNHTHADAVDARPATRWDTSNPLGEPRYPDVMPLARNNAEWRLAWKALYGYAHNDFEAAHLAAALVAKRRKLTEAGEGWPSQVLDAAGIDVALVNSTRIGPGLKNARFRWVPYADPLLDPFSGDTSKYYYSGGDESALSVLKQAGLTEWPKTLEEYCAQVVDVTLLRWKKEGAVAVKFLSAYGRSLDFDLVPEAEAAKLYASGHGGKKLEDYLFQRIAATAGKQDLAVHIHTGNGDGPYFNNKRADPGLLENALNSKALRNTNFVLLHGGWPYHLVTQAMLDKPNTYADFSAQTFYLDTHALSEVLRGWLSWHPEKVMFGSDAYSDVDSALVDWEEKEWLMTWRARRALAIALTAMMSNGEIDRARALEIARMVLRDNAAKLYGIKNP